MRSKIFPHRQSLVFLSLAINVLFFFYFPKAVATDGPSENVKIEYHNHQSCRDLVANPSEKQFLAEIGMKSPAVDYLMDYVSIVAKESSGQLSPETQLALREKIPHQAQWLLNAAYLNFLIEKKQPQAQIQPDSSSSSIIDRDLETRTHLLMRLLAFDTLVLSMKFRFDQQHRLLLEKIVKRRLQPSDLIGLDYEQSAQLQYIILTFALMDTMAKIDRATLELTGNLRQRSAHDLPSKTWELSSKDSNLQALYRQYQILLTLIDQIQQLKIDVEKTNRPMSFTMATSGGFLIAKRLIPELNRFFSLKDFLQFNYLIQESPPGTYAH